jgi:1-acyl-sn-glycerol-3-phosphate acyltransferase
MEIEVIGTPPKPPFFLVTNHLSYVDIGALRSVVKGVFVAKIEVSQWFVAGRIVRDMGIVFIDRKNRRDIPRAGAEIIHRLDEGEGVIVFPEGTSTKGEDILPFNS